MPSSAKYIDTTTIPARGRDTGCPRCGGEVFHAEKMFSKEKVYHKVRKKQYPSFHWIGNRITNQYINIKKSHAISIYFRNALAVIPANARWIRCWHVMAQTTKSTAKDAMQRSLEHTDTGLAVVLHFFKLLTCKWFITILILLGDNLEN